MDNTQQPIESQLPQSSQPPATPPPQYQSPTPLTPTSPSNTKLMYAVIALIAVIAAGGILWWQKDDGVVLCTLELKMCSDGTGVGRAGPNCEFTPCPEEVDISNWKTYTNEEFGFEVGYPEGITLGKVINDDNNHLIMFDGDFSYFQVSIKKSNSLSLEQYNYLDLPLDSTWSLGGSSARVFSTSVGYCDGPSCGDAFIAYIAKHNDNFYHLVFYGDDYLNNIENQILSTFKFIE